MLKLKNMRHPNLAIYCRMGWGPREFHIKNAWVLKGCDKWGEDAVFLHPQTSQSCSVKWLSREHWRLPVTYTIQSFWHHAACIPFSLCHLSFHATLQCADVVHSHVFADYTVVGSFAIYIKIYCKHDMYIKTWISLCIRGMDSVVTDV